MDKNDPYELTRAIAEMNPWERAARHNWALVPQSSEEPFIVTVVPEKDRPGPVLGRLMLFPGFALFRDFIISRQMPDFGVGMSPLDFRHYEAVGLRDGSVELFTYEPGFVPLPPTSEERRMLAPLLFECYGLLMRLEEKPDLPLAYVQQKAMFARKEVVEGYWVDGPFRLPEEEVVQQMEKVELRKDSVLSAKALPLYPKEVWEIDYVMVPAYRTPGPNPRFLYLLAAVNVESGERMVWEKMSVDGKADGLLRLWEGHAQRLLNAFLRKRRVPGAIHVRSARMARFLRPLGLQLPFKLVQHAKLPSLEDVLSLAIQTRNV